MPGYEDATSGVSRSGSPSMIQKDKREIRSLLCLILSTYRPRSIAPSPRHAYNAGHSTLHSPSAGTQDRNTSRRQLHTIMGDKGDTESSLSLLQPATAELSPHLFRRLCWRLIPILWIGYVLNIVDRVNLGYAQLQMKDDLHLAPRTFGLASGIFFIAYALMQVPSNAAIPHIGATRVLSSCMVLWGIMSASTSLCTNATQLIVLRFGLGLAESGFFPGALLFLTLWFPENVSGRALSYFSTAASVGGLLSSAGSGFLMSALDGVGGVRGWRWLLFVQGVPSVLLGLVAPAVLTDRPEQARWLSPTER